MQRKKASSLSFFLNPVEFIGDENDKVKAVKFEKMKALEEKDAKGKRKIVGTGEYIPLEADTVVIAIGLESNKIISEEATDLKTNPDGTLVVDERLMTSISGVFAGGDAIRGEATVILAMGDGKKSCKVHTRIHSKEISISLIFYFSLLKNEIRLKLSFESFFSKFKTLFKGL